MPKRIQLRRSRGWRLPQGTVNVSRASKKFGNPFRVGGYFMLGDPDPSARLKMVWCEAHPGHVDSRFTLIESRGMAVEWFRRLMKISPPSAEVLAQLRGRDLACWCPLEPGQPDVCHAAVWLELANPAR